MHLVITPLAEQDLEGIADYIATDSPRRAVSFLGELRKQFNKIAQSPLAFRLRPELGEGIRSLAYGNYVIFYQAIDQSLLIVRVLHGAMDIESRFDEGATH
jgi:toxin ParE1/3/4